MNRVLRTAKKVLLVLGCTILVIGLMTNNTNVVRAEEEQQQQVQEGSDPVGTTTNTTSKESWSDFLADTNNDQTVIEENPEQLTQEQQMENIDAVGGVGQSKDVYNEIPEETQDEEEDNPVIYTYKVKYLNCDGNVIKEETIETDQPTDDVVVKAEGCSIPTNPRPTTEIPPTSTTVVVEKVYDNTPAAPWYVYLGAVILVVGIAYCIAKPSMSKKAVKQH